MNKLKSFWQRKILIILLLGVLVYLPSLFNPFVWDDIEQVVNSSLIKSENLLSLAFLNSTFNSGGNTRLAGMYYRPITTIFYGLNYQIWHLNSFGFHLFSLLFHLLNAVFVYLLFLKLFSLAKIEKAKFISFALALIFVVHPVNFEAVGYVAATQEVLYCFFVLLGLLFLCGFQKIAISKNFKVLILALITFFSVASKEVGIILVPLGLLLTLYLFKKNFFLILFSFLLGLLSYFFLRLSVAKIFFPSQGIFPMMKSPISERLLSLPKEFTFYLWTYFFPKDLLIAQHWMVKNINFSDFYFPLTISILFFFLIVYLIIKLKSRIFLFFSVWFFLSLGFLLNIFPLDMTVADRWFYFPQIGLLGMVGIIILSLLNCLPAEAPLSGAKAGSIVKILLFASIVLSLSFRTYFRSRDWQSGLILYSHDLKPGINDLMLENNLGTELFLSGKIEEAKDHFEKAIKLFPDWWIPYNNLGAYYNRHGDLDNAQKFYRISIAKSDYYLAYENLGLLLAEKNPVEAISFLNNALEKLPNNPHLVLALVAAYDRQNDVKNSLKWAKYLYLLEPSEKNKGIMEEFLKRQVLPW